MAQNIDADAAFSSIQGDLEIEAVIIRDIKNALEGKPLGPAVNAVGRVMNHLNHYVQQSMRPQISAPAQGGGEPEPGAGEPTE